MMPFKRLPLFICYKAVQNNPFYDWSSYILVWRFRKGRRKRGGQSDLDNELIYDNSVCKALLACPMSSNF